MKRRLLSFLVLLCFLASSLMATSSETLVVTQSNWNSINSLVNNLTKQRDYYKTALEKQRKRLVDLEVYQTNLEKLSGNYRKLTQEEKNLIQSLRTSVVELESKLSKVSQALTEAQEQLQNWKDLSKEKDKLYQELFQENETHKKKTKFWDIIQNIAIVVALALGFYGGTQI